MATYFKPEEVAGLDAHLVALLDQAREQAALPFVITSGCRTADANTDAGGVQDSAHLRGLAVDLACGGGLERYRIVKALLGVGFNRLGIYDHHVHADIDASLPQSVIWIGVSH